MTCGCRETADAERQTGWTAPLLLCFGFGLCAGGDLVTELLRPRLVGLRQKGFTPAAGRQSAADPQSAKEREKDSPLSLWLFTRAAVERRLTGCGSAGVFTCEEDITRSTTRTHTHAGVILPSVWRRARASRLNGPNKFCWNIEGD